MEKNQSFFSSLKQEFIRGLSLSPARSRPRNSRRSESPIGAILRRKKRNSQIALPESSITRSASFRPVGETLTPLIEGPDLEGDEIGASKRNGLGFGGWMKVQLSRTPSIASTQFRSSDLRLLLGVMGAPLAPLHVNTTDPLPHLSIKDTPIETSSAQYIVQQYTAATGGQKMFNTIRNAYAMGKVKMIASEFETATKVLKNHNASRDAESGGFVLWQMDREMWYVELAVGGSKVHAGCNGKLVWRHTPWLGAHTAKGPVRPLRRALQGLDPRTIACMFAAARCIGEKRINGEDCFILKLCADNETLRARSEGPAEIIRHVIFGYFSQKTGLLVHLEDSHLTRIQTNGNDAVYWETTISSALDDYRSVEGILIAHSGRSVVTLFRFGEMAMSHTKTRMEEAWTIEEVVFNVPGLSLDCFIPPADIRSGSISETCEQIRDESGKGGSFSQAMHRAKIVSVENAHESRANNMIWRVD